MFYYLIAGVVLLVGYLVYRRHRNKDKDDSFKCDINEYLNCFHNAHDEKITIHFSDKIKDSDKKKLFRRLKDKINCLRKNLASRYCFVIPNIQLEFNKDLEINQYEIYFLNTLTSTGHYYSNKLLLSEKETIAIFDYIPESSLTFISKDGSKQYGIDRKIINKKLKKAKKSLEDIDYNDYLDVIVDEIESCCYENVIEIIDIKYVSRFLLPRYDYPDTSDITVKDIMYPFFPYLSSKGEQKILNVQQVRIILFELIKNKIHLGDRNYFLQKLFDCLANYDNVTNLDLTNVVYDMTTIINTARQELFMDQENEKAYGDILI